MKHPQSFAKELQSALSPEKLNNIQKYGCCAFVLLWCLHIEPDHDVDALLTLSNLIDEKAIDSDCTVKWKEAVKNLTGRDCTIEFRDIKDLKGIKERTPVRFDYKGNGHWVGVERGMICFNPLRESVCVDKGRPVTARIIKLR